jgi:hypothetical protein
MTRSGWRQPVKMADAVSQTLERLGLQGRVRQHDIWRIWSVVVGEQIARHAQPHSMSHGRLIIHVTDSVWLYQLSMMRHQLMAALNERNQPGQVREMILRVGEVAAMPVNPPPGRSQTKPLGTADPKRLAEIENALAPLGEAPFRDALRRLWLRASAEPASPTSQQGHRR